MLHLLRAVELGKALWGDNLLVYGEPILRRAKLTSGKAEVVSQPDKVFYCVNYQFEKCQFNGECARERESVAPFMCQVLQNRWLYKRTPHTSAACPYSN